MKLNHSNVTVNFRCPEKVRDSFQKNYPYTLTRFLVNCLKIALFDKAFFERIYFYKFEGDKK